MSINLTRLYFHAVLPENCHLSVNEESLPASAAADSTALVTTSQLCKKISIFLDKADPEITWDRLASELQPIRQALLEMAAACQWTGTQQTIPALARCKSVLTPFGAAGMRWMQEEKMQDWHCCGKLCERREDCKWKAQSNPTDMQRKSPFSSVTDADQKC